MPPLESALPSGRGPRSYTLRVECLLCKRHGARAEASLTLRMEFREEACYKLLPKVRRHSVLALGNMHATRDTRVFSLD